MKKKLLTMLLAMIVVFTFGITAYAGPGGYRPWPPPPPDPRTAPIVTPCPDPIEYPCPETDE